LASKAVMVVFGLAALTLGSGMPQPVRAADTLDVIAVRQAGQDLVFGDFTGMLQAVKQKLQNVKPFEKPALALANWEKQFVQMFPPGSDKGHDTKALPAIWTDRATFEKDAQDLSQAALKLAQFAKAGDKAGFDAQVKVVGDACTACHKRFKAK
jgi:cytochrome c556